MLSTSDYYLCITCRDDTFVPELEAVSRLVDMLDGNMFLEGPDRDVAGFVQLPSRDTKLWSGYVRHSDEDKVNPIHRRYVHLTHSPTAVDSPYKHYGELMTKIEGLLPRDQGFVASLGRGTRQLNDAIYCPIPGEKQRWIQSTLVHVVRGYHPIWKRIWNRSEQRREWELVVAKGFILMIACKVAPRAEHMSLEEFIETLRLKEEFVHFLMKVGKSLGTLDFEILGEVSN